jgi:hypothetical protein
MRANGGKLADQLQILMAQFIGGLARARRDALLTGSGGRLSRRCIARQRESFSVQGGRDISHKTSFKYVRFILKFVSISGKFRAVDGIIHNND